MTGTVKSFLKSLPKLGEKPISDYVSDGMTAYTALNSPSKTSVVNSRDAKLHYLFNRVAKNGGEQAHQDLKDEIDHRMYVDKLFE